jgi:Concanavalin A-like lectin/glucanases superfamily
VYGLLSPPNTAPSAPTNLTAVSPATVALQVVLSWVDTANNEGAFKIERSTDNVNFAQIDVASANATTYTDTTVASGTTYYYRVRATNIAGDSGYTLAASATPMALTSPVDLYHFDEGVGTTAADSIGTNTGTLVGGTQPAWVAGRLGAGALSFSGTGAYNQSNQSAVQVASNLATTLGSTSTLDVWVKTTQVGSNTHSQAPAITGVDQTSSANDIDWGTLNASGQIGIFVGDAGTNNGGGIYSINPINDGLWHNIAMTRDAVTGIVQLYVDGVLNGAGGFDTGSKSSPFALIGALSVINSSNVLTGATYFNGQLDEVRIYNRVLAPTEIADIGQIPSAPSGLVASPYSGSIVQLAWLNVSNFSQNIEVQRKTGAGGTYQQIAVLNGDATTYNDIDLDAGTQYYYRVRAIDLAGSSAFSNEANATPPRPTIVGRYTFYNESSFDQYGGSSFIGRGLAIATDKSPLLPGQTATFQNYTSYAKGLNGVMIDVANFEGVITPDDFTILVGNGSDTSLWQPAPTADIAMRAGFGVGGSTRMEIVWDDNDIENEWVQVTLKADAVTKLAAPDVFYFGNVIGDSGNSTTIAADDSADELAARAHGTGLTAAPITSPYDFNRDGHVDTGDQLTARANAGGPVLQLIVAPAAGGGAVSLIADPTGSVPQNMVAAATSPTSGRGPLVDAALEAFNLAAAIPTAGFKSPLVETSFVSRHRTLIDEALLTDLAARQSERTHFQHPLSDHAWHSANDAGAEQAPSQCDPADPGTDTSLAADLFAGKIQRRQARRIGGGA